MANNINYRNASIDALRFIFMIMICLCHFTSVAKFMHHGHLAVEFFFILSGFLLYKSFRNHPDISTIDYTLQKVKRLYPGYIISIVLMMLLDRRTFLLCNDFTPESILETYFSHATEFLMIQSIGIYNGVQANYELWFISVLVVGGGLLYSFLRCDFSKALNIYIPIICILGITSLYRTGNLDYGTISRLGGSPEMARGIAEMGIGIIVAHFYTKKKKLLCSHMHVMNITAVLSFICFMLVSLSEKSFDYLALIASPILIVNCFTHDSIFQKVFSHSIWNKLGSITMEMLYIQAFWVSLYYITSERYNQVGNIQPFAMIIIYLSCVTISAFCLRLFTKKFINA